MTSPITPPPELVGQWSIEAEDEHQPTVAYSMVSLLAAKAAQWGANQELEACVQLLDINGCSGKWIDMLRAARRPKPLTLKDQALLQLDTLNADLAMHGRGCDLSQIRRALEALPND